jgi:alpha-L-fucosidase
MEPNCNASRCLTVLCAAIMGVAVNTVNAQAAPTSQSHAVPPPIPAPAHPAMPVPETIEVADGPFRPTVESLQTYECPEWFRDAKFGLWSHWGPQSVPMQDGWYARKMYVEGSDAYKLHIERYGHPSVFGFKDVVQLWKGEKFDPEHLMRLYANAGAKYFVTMGAHHDNFDLWKSKYHAWNAVNYGPQRDIVGAWRETAIRHGLRFGVSEHIARSYSWFNTSHGTDKKGSFAGVPYDGNDPAFAELYFGAHEDSRATYPISAPEVVQRDWYWRMKDLIETYHPDLVYTDGAIPFDEVGRAAVANFYNANMQHNGDKLEAVYNIKDIKDHGEYIDGGAVQDVERHRLNGINPEPWQTCNSTGPWFYNPGIDYEKEGRRCIQMLIDIVSKNGNLLLNVPQRPDGSLDPEAEQMLIDVGEWMKVNGAGIYATRPWEVFGEGGGLNDRAATTATAKIGTDKSLPEFTAADIRFTRSKDGDTLYVFCLGRPTERVEIRSLGSVSPHLKRGIASVEPLEKGVAVEWQQTPGALVVECPQGLPDRPAFCFKVSLRP